MKKGTTEQHIKESNNKKNSAVNDTSTSYSYELDEAKGTRKKYVWFSDVKKGFMKKYNIDFGVKWKDVMSCINHGNTTSCSISVV